MSDDHFGMGENYTHVSQSQASIGLKVLNDYLPQVLAQSLKEKISVVDIACGPGALTAELARRLGDRSRIVGMDIDFGIISTAKKKESKEIAFCVGDMRSPPPTLKNQFDLAFSNEGLHWTPPCPDEFRGKVIFYRHLPTALREKYGLWGMNQLKLALLGISTLLKTGGVVLLQFGTVGQLDHYFALKEEILNEDRLKKYKQELFFPIYYPPSQEMARLMEECRFTEVDVHTWSEPLAEKSPGELVAMDRAVTGAAFSRVMPRADLEYFFSCFETMLEKDGCAAMQRIKWHRMVVTARKEL